MEITQDEIQKHATLEQPEQPNSSLSLKKVKSSMTEGGSKRDKKHKKKDKKKSKRSEKEPQSAAPRLTAQDEGELPGINDDEESKKVEVDKQIQELSEHVKVDQEPPVPVPSSLKEEPKIESPVQKELEQIDSTQVNNIENVKGKIITIFNPVYLQSPQRSDNTVLKQKLPTKWCPK